MVEANVKIIEDLQTYLSMCCEQTDLKNKFTVKASDFSRNRKLPMKTVALMVLNFLKRSLNVEIQEFFEKALDEQKACCSKGAFCLQRVKLKPSFFFLWNQILAQSFYEHYGSRVKRWKGFRLFATDGSMAYLMNKPGLKQHFGVHLNQYVNRAMARIIQVEDVLNDLTVFGQIFPAATSEQNVAYQLASTYPEDGVLLFDRGFASYALMYLLIHQEQSRHFVIRCHTSNSFKAVNEFMRSGKSSKVFELYPNHTTIRSLYQYGYKITGATGIKVRMVKVKLAGGDTEILLTNLLDEKLYSIEDFKEIYNLRWRIEGKFYKQKIQMQLEEFSGHSVCCIQQDYLANVFLSNLQSIISAQCTTYLALISNERKHTYQINRSASLASMKNLVVKLFLANKDCVWILLRLQKLFERYLEPERPKRTFKRSRINKRYNGRYQTFTNFKRNI